MLRAACARRRASPPTASLFLPQGRDDAENQARYALVDFVLDPMPFGGVNGTLEALDMGVPVVTLVGKRHGERTSYSILANLGVTQPIAQSGREYVDIAVRLADGRRVHARGARGDPRAASRSSPLIDMPRAHARARGAPIVAALRATAPRRACARPRTWLTRASPAIEARLARRATRAGARGVADALLATRGARDAPTASPRWCCARARTRRCGDLPAAIVDLEGALALDPRDARGCATSSGILLRRRRRRCDRAIVAFGRATELDSGYARAWNNLGNALRERGRVGEAEQRLRARGGAPTRATRSRGPTSGAIARDRPTTTARAAAFAARARARPEAARSR